MTSEAKATATATAAALEAAQPSWILWVLKVGAGLGAVISFIVLISPVVSVWWQELRSLEKKELEQEKLKVELEKLQLEVEKLKKELFKDHDDQE